MIELRTSAPVAEREYFLEAITSALTQIDPLTSVFSEVNRQIVLIRISFRSKAAFAGFLELLQERNVHLEKWELFETSNFEQQPFLINTQPF